MPRTRHGWVSSLFYYPGFEHTRVLGQDTRSSSLSLIKGSGRDFPPLCHTSLKQCHSPFIKCDLHECSTVLIPEFEHQLRLELVEQLEFELPCLHSTDSMYMCVLTLIIVPVAALINFPTFIETVFNIDGINWTKPH